MERSWAIISAALAAAFILTALVPVNAANEDPPTVVFSTDFEGIGLFISAWEPMGWSRGDYAQGHGDDLWCRANQTFLDRLSGTVGQEIGARSFSAALYGCRLGTNENNGIDNLVNGYPDPGMDSWVRLAPPKAAYYDGMTLTFWYWAKTHSADHQGPLTDYLCVNINDGVTTTKVWEQPAPDSGGWQMATVELPAGTMWMEWEFKTGDTPTGGPFPGVLIDDVMVTTGSDASGYPSSRIGSMEGYYGSLDVQVPVTVSDAKELALYYRTGDGPWTEYSSAPGPDLAASTLAFHAPGDGQYELFALAGGDGLAEDMKKQAEASFTVDTAPPSVEVISPAEGSIIGPGALSLEWSADDPGSGIARTEVSVDGGSWTAVSAASYAMGHMADGEHSAAVRVTDRSGLTVESSVQFVVDGAAPAMTVSPIGPGADLDVPIVASFQEDVDRGSVSMEISGMSGELSWDGSEASFVPAAPLEPERTYSATIAGTDAGGEQFTVRWSFTTVEGRGSVSGTVCAPDGRAVPGATVTLSNGASARTDNSGKFEISGVTPGSYTITVSGEGYATSTIGVTIVAGHTDELGMVSLRSRSYAAAALDPSLVALLLLVVAAPTALAIVVLRKRRSR